MSDVEDVIIIGSGPAGYTAALYTARANLRPLVIEGFAWGGLLQQTTDVENYPGFPEGVMGPEMMQKFRDQAERFGAGWRARRPTGSSSPTSPGDFTGCGSATQEYLTRTLILAMGAEHKKLDVQGEEDLSGPGGQLLRHLRRGLLQGRSDADRGRRRLGHGGGDLPLEVRIQGHRSSTAAPSSAPRRSCSSGPARRRTSSSSTPTG